MARDAKIYKTRAASKQAAKIGLTDTDLRAAVEKIDKGLVYAHLGHGLYKILDGANRTIIAHKGDDRPAFILFAFPKSDRETIGPKTQRELEVVSDYLSSLDEKTIQKAVDGGALDERS